MKIELKNFAQHAALKIATDAAVVLVVGRNRVGKTTIRDAVEFALLGTCSLRGFALKKDVARYMIREAADRAVVTLDLGRLAIRRTVRSSGAQKIEVDQNRNGGWVDVAAAELESLLPALGNPTAVRCCLESDWFWRIPAAERSAMLVGLAGPAGPGDAEVFDAFPEPLREWAGAHAAAAELRALCEVAVDQGFEAADAVAVEKRREAKRQRAALADAPDDITQAPIDGVDPLEGSVEDMRRAFEKADAEVRAAERSAQLDLGRLTERRDAAVAKLKAADDEWLAVSKTLWREYPKSPWEPGEDVGPTPLRDSDEFFERAKHHAATVKNLEEKAAEIRARCVEIEAALTPPMKEIVLVSKPPERCPAQAFAFPCPVPVEKFLAHRQAEVDARVAAWESAGPIRADLAVELNSLRVSLNAIEAAILEHKMAGQVQLDLGHERDRLGEETLRCKRAVDLATFERDKAETALADAQAAAVAPEAVEALRATANLRAEVLAARERYDVTVARVEKRRKGIADLDARIDWLDAVERELRPDGIPQRLASGGASALRSWIEQHEADCGLVELTPEFDVSIAGRHIASASKSEARLAGLALQTAVSYAVGLPIVIVDELDALDRASRARFQSFASEWASAGETVWTLLGLATSDAEPPAAPPQGFATAWLRPDRVTMIERSDGE